MPKTFSDAELMAYSDDHIAYEVERFFWLTELLTDPSTTLSASSREDARRLNHALIESFALHLRNLLEFLYDDKDSSNIVAAQFCARGVWKLDPKAKPPVLGKAWGAANEQIAHLTDKRKPRDSPDKVWPFKEIADAIRPLIERFTANALTGRLSLKVAAAINAKPEKPSANKPMGIGPAGPGSREIEIVNMTGTAAPISEKGKR